MAHHPKDPLLDQLRKMIPQHRSETEEILEEILIRILGTAQQQSEAYDQISQLIEQCDDHFCIWLLSEPRVNQFMKDEVTDRLSRVSLESKSAVLIFLSHLISINNYELNDQFLLEDMIKRSVGQLIKDFSNQTTLTQGKLNIMHFISSVFKSKNNDLISSFLESEDAKRFINHSINQFLAEPKLRTYALEECILPILKLNEEVFIVPFNSIFIQDHYYTYMTNTTNSHQIDPQNPIFNEYLQPIFQIWTKDQNLFNRLIHKPHCSTIIRSEIKSRLVDNHEEKWSKTYYSLIKPILRSSNNVRSELLNDSDFLAMAKGSIDRLLASGPVNQIIDVINSLVVPILKNKARLEEKSLFELPDRLLLAKILQDEKVVDCLSKQNIQVLSRWAKTHVAYGYQSLLDKAKPPIWKKMTQAIKSTKNRPTQATERRRLQVKTRRQSI